MGFWTRQRDFEQPSHSSATTGLHARDSLHLRCRSREQSVLITVIALEARFNEIIQAPMNSWRTSFLPLKTTRRKQFNVRDHDPVETIRQNLHSIRAKLVAMAHFEHWGDSIVGILHLIAPLCFSYPHSPVPTISRSTEHRRTGTPLIFISGLALYYPKNH